MEEVEGAAVAVEVTEFKGLGATPRAKQQVEAGPRTSISHNNRTMAVTKPMHSLVVEVDRHRL